MYSFTIISTFIVFAAVSFVYGTGPIGMKNVFCSRGSITGVRIEGCEVEPCNVKKGVKVPVEVDFHFEVPDSANDIEFRVFVPYWNVPGTGAFGSYIAKEDECVDLKLQSCPAVASTEYTMKAELYADPKFESSLGLGSTGEVNASWVLSPENKGNFSHCLFEVLINFTE